MVTFLTILLWFGVAVVAILVAVLLTPVRLRARVSTAPKLTYRADVRVLGGIVPPIPIVDSTRPRKPEVKRLDKKKGQTKLRDRFNGGASAASAVFELVAGLTKTIHFEHLKLDAEFGLLDPADTGQLYGCLTPLQFGAPLPQNAFISLRPNFARACFSGEIDASLRFTVAALLPPAVRFVWRVFGPGK